MSVFESLLNNTFLIWHKVRTPSGQGGFPFDYAVVASVNGRMCPASGSERREAMQESREITHTLYVVAGADLTRGNRVSLGDNVWEVKGVREPSMAGEHWEVDCLEKQNERPEAVS